MKYLKPAVQAILRLLDHQGIDYAVIGGLAVSLRSSHRLTEDVDLIIDADIDDAFRLLAVAKKFGLQPMFEEVSRVVEQAALLPLTEVITGTGIDLALGLSGFDQQVIDRATEVWLDDERLMVATVEDLLLMKLNADRPRDQQDIQLLMDGNQGKIDWDYCRETACQLSQVLDPDLLLRIDAIRGNS